MESADVRRFLERIAGLLEVRGVRAEPLEPASYRHLNFLNLKTGDEWDYRKGYTGLGLRHQGVDLVHMIGLRGSGDGIHPTYVRYIVNGLRPTADFWIDGLVRKGALFGLGGMPSFEWAVHREAQHFSLSNRLLESLNHEPSLEEALIASGHRSLQIGHADDSAGDRYGYIWTYRVKTEQIADFLPTANAIANVVRGVAGA